MTTIYRIAWHAGFGGTGTADTARPVEFLHRLHTTFGHLDWVSPFGEYQVTGALPADLDVIRNGRPHGIIR